VYRPLVPAVTFARGLNAAFEGSVTATVNVFVPRLVAKLLPLTSLAWIVMVVVVSPTPPVRPWPYTSEFRGTMSPGVTTTVETAAGTVAELSFTLRA